MSINYDYEKEATEEEIARWMGCLDGMDQYSEDIMDCCEVVSLESIKTKPTRNDQEEVLVDYLGFIEFWDHSFDPEEVIVTMVGGENGRCIM